MKLGESLVGKIIYIRENDFYVEYLSITTRGIVFLRRLPLRGYSPWSYLQSTIFCQIITKLQQNFLPQILLRERQLYFPSRVNLSFDY